MVIVAVNSSCCSDLAFFFFSTQKIITADKSHSIASRPPLPERTDAQLLAKTAISRLLSKRKLNFKLVKFFEPGFLSSIYSVQ